MKFNEKLAKLRKEALLSQEELADELEIDKETISSWELGESEPDEDQVEKLSEILDIPVKNLLNEEKDTEEKPKDKEKNKETRANVINTILVILLIVAIGIIVYSVSQKWKDEDSKLRKLFNPTSNRSESSIITMVNNAQQKQNYDYEKHRFNSKYEMKSGVERVFFVKIVLNDVISDNEQNTRQIIVNYNGAEYVTSDELAKLITNLKKEEYLITYDYDAEGFICQVNIKDV